MNPGRAGRGLVVFARNPVPGRVKTRLIPALGVDGACRLYLGLLDRTLSRVAGISGVETSVWVDSGPPSPRLAPLLQRHALPWYPQSGADLGERMRNAIDRSLETFAQTVLIGSDCPDLDANHVEQAFEVLDRVDTVVGPATDGGYVLIGSRRPIDGLFRDIPWGSDQVLAETLSFLHAARISHRLLPALRDIDTPADLDYLDGLHLDARQIES